MEAEYLKRTVGLPLAAGLAEVAAKRPGDPIEYLAQWLLKHKGSTISRQQVSSTALQTSRYKSGTRTLDFITKGIQVISYRNVVHVVQ